MREHDSVQSIPQRDVTGKGYQYRKGSMCSYHSPVRIVHNVRTLRGLSHSCNPCRSARISQGLIHVRLRSPRVSVRVCQPKVSIVQGSFRNSQGLSPIVYFENTEKIADTSRKSNGNLVTLSPAEKVPTEIVCTRTQPLNLS